LCAKIITILMNIAQLFFERYDPLHNFYLSGIWSQVPYDLMRRRPHPRLNSIAWNLWHLTRVEDSGVNRFVTDGIQVLDKGGWMERMSLPWRHHGSEMTIEEADELSKRIDLEALHDYASAVEFRTREIVNQLDYQDLDQEMGEERLRKILVDEGLAHSQAEGFIRNYLGWSSGKCLMTFGLTHAFQHLGEIEVIASLLGVEF
jgi:hypothetical protein